MLLPGGRQAITFYAGGEPLLRAAQRPDVDAGPAPAADPQQHTSACALPAAGEAHSLHLRFCIQRNVSKM